MPKITTPAVTSVEFTRQEVWDALRKAHPELGMPEKCVDLGDTDDSTPCATWIVDRGGGTWNFEQHESFCVRFAAAPAPKPQPLIVRMQVWEEFKTSRCYSQLPTPAFLEDGIIKPNSCCTTGRGKLIGKVIAVHGDIYEGKDTTGFKSTLVHGDVEVLPEFVELARKYGVDPIDAALAKYPHVIMTDGGSVRNTQMAWSLGAYIGNSLADSYLSTTRSIPEIGRRRVGGRDGWPEIVYREWIAPAGSGKSNLLIVHNGVSGVIRAASPDVKLT